MKIFIGEDGELQVDDRNKFCPFDHTLPEEKQASCGDWCPLFSIKTYHRFNIAAVRLCHNKKYLVHTDDFVDFRQAK